MKICHIAIWAQNLELLKDFYTHFFDCKSGPKYENPKNGFSSYFLHFEFGPSLELMHKASLTPAAGCDDHAGLAHIALALGSVEEVNRFTEKMRGAGYRIIGEPRWTGDGFYESVLLDPEGNRIELTV